MCDSEHGTPCLSHLSWKISDTFAKAYKELESSKETVSHAGRLTEEYQEAKRKCFMALSETDISDTVKLAVAKCLQTSESVLELNTRKRHTKARGKIITPSLAERARQAAKENAEAKRKLGTEMKYEGNTTNAQHGTDTTNYPRDPQR